MSIKSAAAISCFFHSTEHVVFVSLLFFAPVGKSDVSNQMHAAQLHVSFFSSVVIAPMPGQTIHNQN